MATTTSTTLDTWKVTDGWRSSRLAMAQEYCHLMATPAVGDVTPAPMESLPMTLETVQAMEYGRLHSSARTACLVNQVLFLPCCLFFMITINDNNNN
jgi:hypothetical protein